MPLKDLNTGGFCGAQMKGSEHNDLHNSDGTTKRIFPAVFRVESAMVWTFFPCCFKPVATIMQKQESLDNQGNITEMTGKGRHDPCVSREQCLSLKQWLLY
jgi:chorismate synthase